MLSKKKFIRGSVCVIKKRTVPRIVWHCGDIGDLFIVEDMSWRDDNLVYGTDGFSYRYISVDSLIYIGRL